jgi:transposase-like protein
MEDALVTTQTEIAVLPATCPLCHTVHESVTSALLQTGASWTCERCGQTWTTARLQTVAAYERYVAARAARRPATVLSI